MGKITRRRLRSRRGSCKRRKKNSRVTGAGGGRGVGGGEEDNEGYSPNIVSCCPILRGSYTQ